MGTVTSRRSSLTKAKILSVVINHIAVQERCNGLRRFSDEHTDSLNAGSKQLP